MSRRNGPSRDDLYSYARAIGEASRTDRKTHPLTGEIVCGQCGGIGLDSCVCGLSSTDAEK